MKTVYIESSVISYSHRPPEPGCHYRCETGDHLGMVGEARDPIRNLPVGVGIGGNRLR